MYAVHCWTLYAVRASDLLNHTELSLHISTSSHHLSCFSVHKLISTSGGHIEDRPTWPCVCLSCVVQDRQSLSLCGKCQWLCCAALGPVFQLLQIMFRPLIRCCNSGVLLFYYLHSNLHHFLFQKQGHDANIVIGMFDGNWQQGEIMLCDPEREKTKKNQNIVTPYSQTTQIKHDYIYINYEVVARCLMFSNTISLDNFTTRFLLM